MQRYGVLCLFLIVRIFTDAVLLQALAAAGKAPALVGRLLSLAGGRVATAMLARVVPTPSRFSYPAGFRPLAVVALALTYGIFAALHARAPHVQPLVHLA